MSAVSSAVSRPVERSGLPWLIIVAGSIIAMLTFGPRSAMGFFQLPMLAEKGGTGRPSAWQWRFKISVGV